MIRSVFLSTQKKTDDESWIKAIVIAEQTYKANIIYYITDDESMQYDNLYEAIDQLRDSLPGVAILEREITYLSKPDVIHQTIFE